MPFGVITFFSPTTPLIIGVIAVVLNIVINVVFMVVVAAVAAFFRPGIRTRHPRRRKRRLNVFTSKPLGV